MYLKFNFFDEPLLDYSLALPGKDLMDIHTNHNSKKSDHSKSVSRTKYCYSNKINERLDLIIEMGT